jgi:MobA/MobL family
MATFFLRTRTGKACNGAGKKHVQYISGIGRYKEKGEVKFVIDKNLPSWAKTAQDFFAAADEHERANGRSYRSIVFAIPNEAEDKSEWAIDFTARLIGSDHPCRLAVHLPDDGHNPHGHLMFCEREKSEQPPEAFFSRKNKKNPKFSGSQSNLWLNEAKSDYLTAIRTLCPDYIPAYSGEQKIGAKLKNAGSEYEKERQERETQVMLQRADVEQLKLLNIEIETVQSITFVDVLANSLTQVKKAYEPTAPRLNDIGFKPSSSKSILNEAGFQPSSKIVISHPLTTHSLPPRKRYRYGN